MPWLKKNKAPKAPKQKKAKKHKGKIIGLVVLGIIVAAIVGISVAYRYYGTKAYVSSVMDMNMTWVLYNSSSEGVIQDAATQNIYWDATTDIVECYVQKGDKVEAGDKLFKYDTASLQLQVEQAQLSLDVAQYNLQVAKQELEETGKATIVPSAKEQANEMERLDKEYEKKLKELEEQDAARQEEADTKYSTDYELTYDRIKTGADVENIATFKGGTGVAGDPFIYECTDKTIISKKTVESLITDDIYVELRGSYTGADGSAKTYDYSIGGSTGVPFTSAYRAVATMEEFDFPSVPATQIPELKYPEYDPKGLTEQEKKEQTASGEVGIKKAENEVKSAEINLQDAKRRLEEATVTAKIGGVVLNMGDYENPPQDGSPFITISSENGLAVTGYVSELEMDSIKEGDEININSWESGAFATAKVTEVSQYPAANYDGYTDGNSNVSWYPYTAIIEDAEGFKTGEYVQITKQEGDMEDAIVLMKIYVRSDEKGNYVLKDNGNGRLVRQDVTVKRTAENEYVQIMSGLTLDDMIAFPYGSKGKVGIKTTTQMSAFDMLF